MKVAVIGAGIAGLTVASELTQRGLSVTVFEKSRGVGGRLANKRLGWGNIDIGAQYFTARDERFKKQLAVWQQQGAAHPWQFDPHKIEAGNLVASPDTTPRYVGTPKMNSVAHALAQGLAISFSTRINTIEHHSLGWRLVTENGEHIPEPFDWVVISAPAEQARQLLAGTALESKIPRQVLEPCWALALATLGDVPEHIQGIFGDDLVSWVSRLSSRPQRPKSEAFNDVWMLHFSSEWSAQHTKTTELNIARVGFEWLGKLLGPHISAPLTLVHDYQHYWRYARTASTEILPEVIADRATGIAAVGDWTMGGRVEGAYVSALNFVEYFLDQLPG